MGHVNSRDLLLAPGLLSLARVPLAAVFPVVVRLPEVAFGVLALAAVTDILDGWIARRFGQTTATGAMLDPLTDKLFVGSVVATLLVTGVLDWWALLLLSVRELGELPLVAWIAVSRRHRRAHAEQAQANLPGKLATVMQFATVSAALLSWGFTYALLYGTAVAGALAALSYWIRAVATHRGTQGK